MSLCVCVCVCVRQYTRVRDAACTIPVQKTLTPRINIPSAWLTPVSQIANAVARRQRARPSSWKNTGTGTRRAADSARNPTFSFGRGDNAGSGSFSTVENKIAGHSRLIRWITALGLCVPRGSSGINEISPARCRGRYGLSLVGHWKGRDIRFWIRFGRAGRFPGIRG